MSEGGYDAASKKFVSKRPVGHAQEPMEREERGKKNLGSFKKPSKKGYVVSADKIRHNPESRMEKLEKMGRKAKSRASEIRGTGTRMVEGFSMNFPAPSIHEMRMPSGMGRIGMGFAPPSGWMMGPMFEQPAKKKPSRKSKREPREPETSWQDMMSMPPEARRWMM